MAATRERGRRGGGGDEVESKKRDIYERDEELLSELLVWLGSVRFGRVRARREKCVPRVIRPFHSINNTT